MGQWVAQQSRPVGFTTAWEGRLHNRAGQWDIPQGAVMECTAGEAVVYTQGGWADCTTGRAGRQRRT